MDPEKLTFRMSDKFEDAVWVNESLHEHRMSRTGEEYRKTTTVHKPEQATFLVCDENGERRGGLVYYWLNDPRHIFIIYFFLEESLRGHGVGRKIMEQFIQWAREHGAEYIDVESNTYQAPGFYLKVGYHITGETSEPYPNYPHNIHYAFRMYLNGEGADKK